MLENLVDTQLAPEQNEVFCRIRKPQMTQLRKVKVFVTVFCHFGPKKTWSSWKAGDALETASPPTTGWKITGFQPVTRNT